MVVTQGNKQELEKKLFDVLNKLEKAGYQARKKKSEFFMNKTKALGLNQDENGRKSNKKCGSDSKLDAIGKLKKLKSFLGALQYMAKFLLKLSEQTDRSRKLLKKTNPGNRDWNKKRILT